MARKKSMLDVANQWNRIYSLAQRSKSPIKVTSERLDNALRAARKYTYNMSQLGDSRVNLAFRQNKDGRKKYSRAYYTQSTDLHTAKLMAKGNVAG